MTITGVTGGNVRVANVPMITALLQQLQVRFAFTDAVVLREMEHGPEDAQLGLRFDSYADAAALAHALPVNQVTVMWYDIIAVHDALPGTPSKRGRRVVLIDGKPVTVWREVGVAVGMGERPPTPLQQGVYFAALDADVRFLSRDITQFPSSEEVETMPADAVAQLWQQAQHGWPVR